MGRQGGTFLEKKSVSTIPRGAKNLLNDCCPLQTVWLPTFKNFDNGKPKLKHINWGDFHFVKLGLIQLL